jgi:hypothetical protein
MIDIILNFMRNNLDALLSRRLSKCGDDVGGVKIRAYWCGRVLRIDIQADVPPYAERAER